MTNRRRILLAGVLIACVMGCDQTAKYHALATLTDTFKTASGLTVRIERFLSGKHPSPTGVLEVIPGIWHFRYVENPGSAFSLWKGGSSDAARIAPENR